MTNQPVNVADPTGHCFSGAVADTILCAAVAGAAASGATTAAIIAATAPASISAAFIADGVANTVGNQVGALNTDDNESFLENYAEAGGVYNGQRVTSTLLHML